MSSDAPRSRSFAQVDVFGAGPYRGNPVAVVLDAEGLDDAALAAFAAWTNLSETTFVLPPEHPEADYRVRILTPREELPFAGHPTLGTAHAWLEAGGVPRRDAELVQECGVGLVRLRRSGSGLAFAAPPPRSARPVASGDLARAVAALGLDPEEVVDHQCLDNGPQWQVLLLRSGQRVLELDPDPAGFGDLLVGVVGPHADGETQFEVRGFAPGAGVPEDPVTGSLNASVAQWLIGTGRAPASYLAGQGARVGRQGRVEVTSEAAADGADDGAGRQVWIGGAVRTAIRGVVEL